MNRIVQISGLMLLFLTLFTSTVFSQKFLAGGGMTQHGYYTPLGYNIRAYVKVNPEIIISPEVLFSFWAKESESQINDWLVIGGDINVHYNIEVAKNLIFYPLLGIHVRKEQKRETFKYISVTPELQEWILWALNYGVGMQYQINDIVLFAEFGENTIPRPRYVMGTLYQF